MLFEIILAIWGCMAELDPSCTRDVFDMTNAASTWVGLVAGVGIGAIILLSTKEDISYTRQDA